MQRPTGVETGSGLAAVLAGLAAALCACTVRPAQPNLVGQDIRLTIIHTADIHSRLFPYDLVPNARERGDGLIRGPFGGIARISTLVQQIRRTSNRSLWLDSGDFSQGAPVFDAYHGEAELRALTLAGLDGAVLGDHELDRGARNLLEQIDHRQGVDQGRDLDGALAYVDPAPAGGVLARSDASGGDSQLGNLLARSMLQPPGVAAQFAQTSSLGLHGDVERGPLRAEQLFDALPFDRTIAVMALSGVELQQMLDGVAQRSAERGCASQVKVAGIAFDLVCRGACPGGATACARHVSLGDHCRTADDPDGEIDPARCAPILPPGLYRVAVDSYIAAGGAGFDGLARNASNQDTGASLRDSLRIYLRGQTACGPSLRARRRSRRVPALEARSARGRRRLLGQPRRGRRGHRRCGRGSRSGRAGRQAPAAHRRYPAAGRDRLLPRMDPLPAVAGRPDAAIGLRASDWRLACAD